MNSPDLNPIEHLRAHKLSAFPPADNQRDYWEQLLQVWQTVPTEKVRALIDSMPRCVASVADTRASSYATMLPSLACPIYDYEAAFPPCLSFLKFTSTLELLAFLTRILFSFPFLILIHFGFHLNV